MVRIYVAGNRSSGKRDLLLAGFGFTPHVRETIYRMGWVHFIMVHADGSRVPISVLTLKERDDYHEKLSNADCVILCCPIDDPGAIPEALNFWIPCIMEASPGCPVIVAGSRSDIRLDPRSVLPLADEDLASEVVGLYENENGNQCRVVDYVEWTVEKYAQVKVRKMFNQAITLATEREHG